MDTSIPLSALLAGRLFGTIRPLQLLGAEMQINLVSCDTCATVYDATKLPYKWREDEDGAVDPEFVAYDQNRDEYKPFVECRVCLAKIFAPSDKTNWS